MFAVVGLHLTNRSRPRPRPLCAVCVIVCLCVGKVSTGMYCKRQHTYTIRTPYIWFKNWKLEGGSDLELAANQRVLCQVFWGEPISSGLYQFVNQSRRSGSCSPVRHRQGAGPRDHGHSRRGHFHVAVWSAEDSGVHTQPVGASNGHEESGRRRG